MSTTMFDGPAVASTPRLKPGRRVMPKVARDQTRGRLFLAICAFTMVYGVLAGRLVYLGLTETDDVVHYGRAASEIATTRPDIVDRNGEILATDINTASLYAEPRRIIDPDEAAELINSVLPDLKPSELRRKLSGDAGFVWLKREISPAVQAAIHRLGIPGIGFLTEKRRFYPGGPAAAHVVGLVNVDNQGIAGIERAVDQRGLSDLHGAGFAMGRSDLEPVELSLDLRVQHVLRDELASAMERYHAVAATGVIVNAKTGEVLALASLPDFDPNNPVDANKPDRLNRMTAGTYELGSVFKSFTFAMAFDSGRVKMDDTFDARAPIRVGRFTISDFHGKHRVLSVPEIFLYSSNIATAKMALAVGLDNQRGYLERFGLLSKLQTDLPEVATPQLPKKWSDVAAMTVSFGHGIAITPMQAAMADVALVNGGILLPPTFFRRTEKEAMALGTRIISPETSDKMRYLFNLNIADPRGSGSRAGVPGYRVGGKTGTAEKVENGRYVNNKRLNSFLAAFPMDDPNYVVLVTLDEPKPEREGIGATAGLNAAPTVGAIVRRSAALLGVKPEAPQPGGALLVSY
ncbi:peptidoglycan D,D-transpeptidase FtsI family protein [Prosthecomicrobium pneumaticum]|uniref:Cell division protein FtsI (Penicillin-binding protein 3) n=1 Tax=Prosthecomicrobium pneumaticum TaxID=81895 RepID=A0A7W9FLR7_9HYPH|nr:penicillin-binding protein 2 [Prosthecomicrobium pneumaticum]MBB5753015.1 cell division protein FtsI (penicillin-binding protein 3) [Prosthecomicrobium pneumaticum]